MKKLLVTSLCICLLPVSSLAAEKTGKSNKWYMLQKNSSYFCSVAHGSPAEFMQEVKSKGFSYTVDDDAKDGRKKKPDFVVVTVEGMEANFFRNLEFCKITAKALNERDKAQLEKYK